MSIENITGRILSEAEEQSRAVLEEAGQMSRSIIKKAEEQAGKIQEKSSAKAKEDAELLKNRRISVAELEVRKLRLGEKQARIARCFDSALNRLAALEEERYIELLSSAILSIGADGGELILNTRDREAIGEKLLNKVNAGSKEAPLTLAEDTIEAKGGFVLRKGAMEINSTLETMVNSIRESATPSVVKALFD